MSNNKEPITEDEFNQFIISIKSGALEQIDQYLSQYGSEITNRLESQLRQPPLYFAVNLPDDSTCLSVVKKLVSNGANPKFKDTNDQSVVFYACRDGKKACIDYLQELGVSIFEADAYGQTPLYYIASENQLSLLDNYKDSSHFNHIDKLAEQTPLYYAAKKGHLEMCKALIERGCDPTLHDTHNKTAVEYARRARYHEVTDYLVAEVKKAKESKIQQQAAKEVKAPPPKKNEKKEVEAESPVHVIKSFYKLAYVNEHGEVKELTEEDIRNLVKEHPNLESILANPSSIPKEALLEAKQKDETEKWQKVALKVFTTIWKHKQSVWFQEPVDPVKFGIMDYNDIITNPMDLTTIRNKLTHNFYPSPKSFESDMKLIWDNCYKYNGEDHEISIFAKELESLFDSQYEENIKKFENS